MSLKFEELGRIIDYISNLHPKYISDYDYQAGMINRMGLSPELVTAKDIEDWYEKYDMLLSEEEDKRYKYSIEEEEYLIRKNNNLI